MVITIENITWNFVQPRQYDEFADSLGLAYVGIPHPMLKRFIKECRWDEDVKVPPHYFQEDLDYLWGNNYGEDQHDCYNSDTQIVLMNWLHDKQRKYTLEYRGNDPFWIFHDHCHSKGDVYSYEVNNINSSVEHYRLMEGAMMARDWGVYMKPETAADIVKAWKPRFKMHEGNNMTVFTEADAYSLLENDEAQQEFDHLMML